MYCSPRRACLVRGLILCVVATVGGEILAGPARMSTAVGCGPIPIADRAAPADVLDESDFAFRSMPAGLARGGGERGEVREFASSSRPGHAGFDVLKHPLIGFDHTTGESSPSRFAETPTVFRGQSPEVSLLPLAGGEATVETANYRTPLLLGNGRLSGNYLTDLDETDKIGVQVLTQGGLGLGIDAEVNYWRRPVAGLGREPLWGGDLNMMYNLSPIKRFKLRSGAGGNWMLDGGDPRFGYNFTHGLDVYLLWRGMFTGEIDWGKIDGDNLFRYRLGLGLTVNSFDIFSGYESQTIGDERLDGWMNGIAIWY